jgi:hypothetical protein
MTNRLCTVLLAAGVFSESHVAFASQNTASVGDFHAVPAFTVEELSFGHRTNDLAEALRSTGMIAVKLDHHVKHNDFDIAESRRIALGGLCGCASSDASSLFQSVSGADTSLLSDGETTRSTFATATVGGTPLQLPVEGLEKACGRETTAAMESLRDNVAVASRSFVSAVDRLHRDSSALPNSLAPILQNIQGGTYSSLASIVKASTHLEHFHLYSKQQRQAPSGMSQASDMEEVLQVHTDAGLFLSFVPGLACGNSHTSESEHFSVLIHGKLHRAVFPPDSVGIMLGAGAQHWLKNVDSLELHATHHAVQMPSGSARAWYGMMHLVPQNAIIQEDPEPKTFADMRKAMVLSGSKTHKYGGGSLQTDEALSIGCGAGSQKINDHNFGSFGVSASRRHRRRLQMVDDASVCNNSTNFYCWMSCLDIPEAQNAQGYLNEGYSLYCLDPATLSASGNRASKAMEPCIEDGVVGLAMNENCMGSWQPTAPGVVAQELALNFTTSEEEPFCYGGTSMYMDGFHWLDSTCVIYLFPEWVLSTPGKLVAACVGSIFFGMSLEGVIRGRRDLVQSIAVGWKRLFISSGIYGLQLTMGYFIMLVVMTYSGPLFMCVVLGLMFGHIAFNAKDVLKAKKQETKEGQEECCGKDESEITDEELSPCCQGGMEKNNVTKVSANVPEGSTPCCQNLL